MERMVGTTDGRVVVDFERVAEVHVWLVGGDVSIGGTAAPPRLEVECLRGDPVRIADDDGIVIVEQRMERGIRFGVTRGPEASVALTVPPGTPVDVHTVAASVLTAGLAGDIAVKTVSGTLTATYLSGAVELNSVSGDIEVEAVSGRLKATSVSGNVTVNAGSVTELSAKSMSGELALDLDIKPAGRYECRTASGDIALRLSPDASVGVEATSLSGRLDDGYSADGRSTRHRLSMQLGQADARLRAQTLSGDIALLKRLSASTGAVA